MPVCGRELASLDFANLIGSPLNAVVESQAKSAITTANFIKEVNPSSSGRRCRLTRNQISYQHLFEIFSQAMENQKRQGTIWAGGPPNGVVKQRQIASVSWAGNLRRAGRWTDSADQLLGIVGPKTSESRLGRQ